MVCQILSSCLAPSFIDLFYQLEANEVPQRSSTVWKFYRSERTGQRGLTSQDLFLTLAASFWKLTLNWSIPGQQSVEGLAEVGAGMLRLVRLSWMLDGWNWLKWDTSCCCWSWRPWTMYTVDVASFWPDSTSGWFCSCLTCSRNSWWIIEPWIINRAAID